MSNIKAVIFDVDGTMVDSEPLHVLAWDNVLKLYNHKLSDLSEEMQSKIAGRKPLHIAADLINALKIKESPEIFLQKRQKLFIDSIKTNITAMPGLHKALEYLKDKSYLLGIGTAQTKEYISLALETLEVKDYFDVIVTGDEIIHGKPHPETYELVAKKLGILPQDCVVIEDAESGIISAKAAGCKCIAIKNPNGHPQNISKADHVINSLDEITKEFIENL